MIRWKRSRSCLLEDLDENAYIVAIDGTATPRMIENCEKLGCSNLIASNFVSADTDINLVSM
jgi:hypothetical protein